MKVARSRRTIFLFSFGNGLVMLLLSFLLMRSVYVNGDERILIGYLAQVKNIVFGLEAKPPVKDFIFVNVAYDLQLTDKKDDDGFTEGKTPVTDRRKLAKFLHILNTQPDTHKLILCDIFFKDSVSDEGDPPEDKLLGYELQAARNIITANHMNDDTLQQIIFNVPSAIADFRSADGVFFKFKLVYQDSVKALPLKIYEMLHGSKATFNGLFVKVDGKRFLNSVIPPLYIRQFDLFGASIDRRYKVDNLTNILSGAMSDADILSYVKDRIIVIGDFDNNDVHETIYGNTGGSLILLNTFLMLERGDNQVTFAFILFLFVCYFLVSLSLFYSDKFIERIKNRLHLNFARFLPDLLGIGFLLIMISVMSYLLFGTCVSILYLSFYLFALKAAIGKVFAHA